MKKHYWINKMKISEIKANQGNINISAEVQEIQAVKEIEKFGRKLKLANAIIQDDSGKIKLTLWNSEIDKIKAGDKISIINGYAKEYMKELQLTAGKFGKIEVIKSSEKFKNNSDNANAKGTIEVEESDLYDDEEEW